MNANIFGAVARRLVNHFNRDLGLNVRNRILTASCLFQLARLSQELTAETIDLWLKEVNGKIKGFSQIHLIDLCRNFAQTEPQAFRALWTGEAEAIHEALLRFNTENDPYRAILKLTLYAIADELYGTATSGFNAAEIKLKAEQSLTGEEWMDFIYLKTDFRRFLNAEIGEIAFNNLSAPVNSEIIVEVIM